MNLSDVAKSATGIVQRNIKPAFDVAMQWAKRNKKEILVGSGIASLVASNILTARATVKSVRAIDALEATENRLSTTKEKVKICWKNYIPPVVAAGYGATGVILAARMSHKETAALSAAYEFTRDKLTDYKDAIADVGEKTQKEIEKKVDEKSVENRPLEEGRDGNLILTNGGTQLFYTEYTGRYLRSSIPWLEERMAECCQAHLHDETMTLNDIDDFLNLDPSDLGDYAYWPMDGVLPEFVFDTKLSVNGEATIVARISPAPIIHGLA